MRILLFAATLLNMLIFGNVSAEVDKVYHPYVEVDTYEFETRIISLLDSELAADFSVYRFGFGKDVTENLFLELYLIGNKNAEKNLEVEAFEIEALYQVTEQGEFWADFGLLFEVERERKSQEWEGNIGFIFEKELGQWSAAVNLQNLYEFKDNNRHAWKHSQAFQMRYRNSPSFEPGIELYSDKNDLFLGAVFLGQIKMQQSKFNWEVGLLREVNNADNESVLRALIEYEF